MKNKLFVHRNAALIYFVATFLISWAGSFLLIAPKLLRGEAIQQMDGLKMFPIMLLGPSITGICLTGILYGKIGLRELFSRIKCWQISLKWYSALLIPPIVISLVLFVLGKIYPNEFSPSYFFIGFLFGIPAGLIEEIGWTGFAFPHLQKKFSLITSGIILGLLWGLWHFPVIDSLGSASPHGKFLLPFFLAFILLMTAIRVIICRVYAGTKSVLLAQLFHISSTGFLVVLSPSGISPKQEVFWYLVYAAVLWLLIIVFRRKLFTQATTNRNALSESMN